jgi:hypothetical protein
MAGVASDFSRRLYRLSAPFESAFFGLARCVLSKTSNQTESTNHPRWAKYIAVLLRQSQLIRALVRNVLNWYDKDLIAEMWYNFVLRNPTSTHLTVPTERLIAISAITKLFRQKLQVRYLAALWDYDLFRTLCWYCVSPKNESARCVDYIAPSWS